MVSKQYQAEPQGESAHHDEARLDHCEMVNAEVVQRKIVFLPREICPTFASTMLEALLAVIQAVIGQKSAEGVVVDSY